MKTITKARTTAAAALLVSMLSICAGPAAANGHAALGATALGAIVEPMLLTMRMAAGTQDRLAARMSDAAANFAEHKQTTGLRTEASEDATGSIARRAEPVPAGPRLPAYARQRVELLASVAIPFGRLPALRRMQPVYVSMKEGIFGDCRTASCENGRATLETVVASGRERGTLPLIAAVNRSVNKLIAYRRDRDTHGVIDFWASPSQTLNAGIGDCEDYAILKMAVLEQAGVPAADMSLVVLRDQRRSVYHAVLAVRTERGAYILDNLDQSIRLDSDLPDYMPLYSVSAGRGYIHGRRSGARMFSASAGYDAIAPGEGLEAQMPLPALSQDGLHGPL